MKSDTAVAKPDRLPVAARRRHGHPFRALIGVGVLAVVIAVSGAAAVQSLNRIFYPNAQTKLERYLDGNSRVRYASKDGGFVASFPATPNGNDETLAFVGDGHRVIGTIEQSSFELAWFTLPPVLRAADPSRVLPSLSGPAAAPLHADKSGTPVDGKLVSGSRYPAYEFVVHPVAGDRVAGDYAVRLVLDGARLFVLRVRTPTGAMNALHVFASTLVITAK